MGGIISKNKRGENEDDFNSVLTDKQLERELKLMEKQLMFCYEKWDVNKRINHECAMASFIKLNKLSN